MCTGLKQKIFRVPARLLLVKQNNNARKVVSQDIKSEQSKFSPKPNSLRSMLKANGEKLGTIEKTKEHNEQMRKALIVSPILRHYLVLQLEIRINNTKHNLIERD